MRTEKREKVLEKLATSDKATIIIERQTELKCARRLWRPVGQADAKPKIRRRLVKHLEHCVADRR
jgi:hypothetical protein